MENMKEELGGIEDSESPIYICHKFRKEKIQRMAEKQCLKRSWWRIPQNIKHNCLH